MVYQTDVPLTKVNTKFINQYLIERIQNFEIHLSLEKEKHFTQN